MLHKIAEKYRTSSLYLKITAIILGMTILITLLITLIAYFYYGYMVRNSARSSALNGAENAAATIEINYNNILDRFVSICGTKDFADDLISLGDPEVSDILKRSLIQDELSDLSNINFMVDSALFLSADGKEYYTLYQNSISSGNKSLISEDELRQVNGITWLTQRSSPFRSNVNVIPIVIPMRLSYIGESHYPNICKSPDEAADIYLVLLLDSAKIMQSLTISGEFSSSDTFVFLTGEGRVITPVDEIPADLTISEDMISFVRDFTGGSDDEAIFTADKYYLVISRLSRDDLFLLSCVNRQSMMSIMGSTWRILICVLSAVIIIVIALSLLLSHYVTGPLNKLVGAVKQIGENNYTQPVNIATGDEIGELSLAINEMYDTIKEQMIRIKDEESAKYMAQIRLLTEQINPHFLYNTLECIQLEVTAGNSETASGMIQSLAEYMRISLSYGDDMITISNELRHVRDYILLMSKRFHQPITFLYKVSPGLEEHYILKNILQPLAENSIKHGFSIDGSGIPISTPTIEINFYDRDEYLYVDITDNGSGFDASRTDYILHHDTDPDNGKHVGLHNIYIRLTAYYGEENISFTLNSIPYYQNSILIRLPLNAKCDSPKSGQAV